MQKLLTIFLVSITLSACASIERLAIPENKLIDSSFAKSGNEDFVEHNFWDLFLQKFVAKDSENIVRVDYANVSEAEHSALKDYIKYLSAVDSSKLTKDAQLAYWANLYNAQTVDVILDNYPVASIRDIKDGFFDLGPWENKRLVVSGKELSLHDIEHGIVRAIWADTPEVHYILNCAAIGCPNLSEYAFTADNVNELMFQYAADYVNDPRGVEVQPDNGLVLSKIYSWYQGDFGGSESTIIEHLKIYAEPKLKAILEDSPDVEGYGYDWALNEAVN